MKPRVLNKHDLGEPLPNAVYVGRPSKWGNPFTHQSGNTLAKFKVASREAAVQAYKDWLLGPSEEAAKLRADAKRELKGKDLICWCSPRRCHAEILLEIANEA